MAAVLVLGAIRRGFSRPRLAAPCPADAVGPFVGGDFLELAVYGGDNGAEVLVTEGVGYEDAARVGPALFDLCVVTALDVSNGQIMPRWVSVTVRSLLGRSEHPRACERHGEYAPVRVEGRVVGGDAARGDGEVLSDHAEGRL